MQEIYSSLLTHCHALLAAAEHTKKPLSFAIIVGATQPALAHDALRAYSRSPYLTGQVLFDFRISEIYTFQTYTPRALICGTGRAGAQCLAGILEKPISHRPGSCRLQKFSDLYTSEYFRDRCIRCTYVNIVGILQKPLPHRPGSSRF